MKKLSVFAAIVVFILTMSISAQAQEIENNDKVCYLVQVPDETVEFGIDPISVTCYFAEELIFFERFGNGSEDAFYSLIDQGYSLKYYLVEEKPDGAFNPFSYDGYWIRHYTEYTNGECFIARIPDNYTIYIAEDGILSFSYHSQCENNLGEMTPEEFWQTVRETFDIMSKKPSTS